MLDSHSQSDRIAEILEAHRGLEGPLLPILHAIQAAFGHIPEAAIPQIAAALTISKALLLLAVTATAMRSRMDLIMDMGWRAAVPVLTATLTSFAVSLAFTINAL